MKLMILGILVTLLTGCPGGGGTVHIPPPIIVSDSFTELKVTFSVWGAGSGKLNKRYTNVVCIYHIVGVNEEHRITGKVVSADDKHMEMVFILPPLNLNTEDAVTYHFEMLFDGHENVRSGGTLKQDFQL
jgi:hypothetical protein